MRRKPFCQLRTSFLLGAQVILMRTRRRERPSPRIITRGASEGVPARMRLPRFRFFSAFSASSARAFVHFVRLCPGYVARYATRPWRTRGQNDRGCPCLTAPVRPWPPKLDQAASDSWRTKRFCPPLASTAGHPAVVARVSRPCHARPADLRSARVGGNKVSLQRIPPG
jgi:hypothetical protein